MTACPICGKPVDSLRAPAVKVRAGKVVAFCSSECAQLGETKPTEMPAAGRARTPASGVVAPTAALESGPVIEIVHEPASGVVTSARDERIPAPPVLPDVEIKESKPKRGTSTSDTLDKWTLTDEQVGERASTGTSMAPPRSPLPLIVLLVLLVGAGGFLAYRYLIAGRGDAPVADPAPPTPGSAVAPPIDATAAAAPAPPIDAVGRARTTLQKYLKAESPRIQRVAATALARTQDPDAIALLVAALARETSDVAKLEIAYALARAADKRGGDALATAATAGRSRDVRAEAARLLALLRDPRAVPTLANYLDVSQLRLGAAEQLAYVAEPKALKVLDAIRADDKASPDDRARATIALGIAGRADVAGSLQALLTDARFNSFAAVALAQLHDPSARPILIKQLEIPSLRVGAARALRVLDPALDPTPQLPALALALDSGKDTDQAQAAEAILLLAGPVEWSKYP